MGVGEHIARTAVVLDFVNIAERSGIASSVLALLFVNTGE